MKWFWFIPAIIFIFGSNYLTNKIGNEHFSKTTDLFDLGHILIPDLHEYYYIYNLCFYIVAASFFALSTKGKIDFFTKLVIIYVLRGITILVTILPKHHKCENSDTIFTYINGDCFDKIFSGHTSFMFLLTLFLMKENLINLPVLIGINLANIFSILAVRSHYTVDVLLALLITFFINNY
jgi:hypothetical protein